MTGAVAAMAGISLSPALRYPALAASGSGSGAGRPARSSRVLCCLPPQPAAGAGSGQCDVKGGAAKLLMPLLAAAVVGSSQPAAFAANWAVVGEVDNSRYQELLIKIKERNEQGQVSDAGDVVAPAPVVSKLQQIKDAAEKARQEREAAEQKAIQEREQAAKEKAAAAAAEAAKKAEAAQEQEAQKSVEAEKKAGEQQQANTPAATARKTHGALPLFLSQLLLLVAAGGFGAALFVLPESSWKQAEKTIDDLAEKAVPVIDGLYAKFKPISEKAIEKTVEKAREAQPYVVKTWEAAKPAAAKAYEASKPLVKEAQVKAAELLKQVQERAKSS